MLESLWHNLQDIVKTEENNPLIQTFQPHIPNPVQIHHVIPNPPRPMASRFFPLVLPVVLHDLPQNYSQRISLFDGEENFTVREHMDRFEDFIDLEEVEYDDAKMRLFSQILSREEKICFKYLLARSMFRFEAFQILFLDRWEDKKSPLQVLSQYNNLKKRNFESVHQFFSRFMRVYNSIL